MIDPLYGYSFLTIVISIAVGVAYFFVLIMLGWESHSEYGTGYYWVGACILGAVASYFNYRHYLNVHLVEEVSYPLWLLIVTGIFTSLIGLWTFLIYHAIVLKKRKGIRSGSRLVKRVFSENQASTGTGRFREMLKGWEGDIKLDALIVEKKFDLAEDYLQGIIMKANNEKDEQKTHYYGQYSPIIQTERLKTEAEEAMQETPTIKDDEGDFKRAEQIDQDALPEGWSAPD